MCNDGCGQHIHSLSMVGLSTVKARFCFLWSQTSVRNRDHLENSPGNAGSSQGSFPPLLTTFLIIPFLTQLRSNVCLTSTNTTMTLHIRDVSLQGEDDKHTVMCRMVLILFNIPLEDTETFLHMVGEALKGRVPTT